MDITVISVTFCNSFKIKETFWISLNWDMGCETLWRGETSLRSLQDNSLFHAPIRFTFSVDVIKRYACIRLRQIFFIRSVRSSLCCDVPLVVWSKATFIVFIQLNTAVQFATDVTMQFRAITQLTQQTNNSVKVPKYRHNTCLARLWHLCITTSLHDVARHPCLFEKSLFMF